MRELALACKRSSTQLRRDQKANRAARVRDLITYGCLLYAANLISKRTKCEAAMTLAGFRNKTNFNRDFRTYLGCLPHEFAGRRPTADDPGFLPDSLSGPGSAVRANGDHEWLQRLVGPEPSRDLTRSRAVSGQPGSDAGHCED